MPRDMLFQAVYHTTVDDWDRISLQHSLVLSKHVKDNDRILDVGCGWGRLIDLLPMTWGGAYTGVDLSPDFIALARQQNRNPAYTFVCGRAEDVLPVMNSRTFDLAVCVSIKRMLTDNQQADVWTQIEREMLRVADHVLILEYDHESNGEVLQ